MFYEAAKKRAEPYMKIVEEIPQMRRETEHHIKTKPEAVSLIYAIRASALKTPFHGF
jgi:hypothetical protein